MIGRGFLIGRNALTGFNFDPSLPYAGCRICGKVYQPGGSGPLAEIAIRLWRGRHNATHSEREHRLLEMSGRKFTPEAAQQLSVFGIIDFGGIMRDDEIAHALRVASARPTDDAEGVAE